MTYQPPQADIKSILLTLDTAADLKIEDLTALEENRLFVIVTLGSSRIRTPTACSSNPLTRSASLQFLVRLPYVSPAAYEFTLIDSGTNTVVAQGSLAAEDVVPCGQKLCSLSLTPKGTLSYRIEFSPLPSGCASVQRLAGNVCPWGSPSTRAPDDSPMSFGASPRTPTPNFRGFRPDTEDDDNASFVTAAGTATYASQLNDGSSTAPRFVGGALPLRQLSNLRAASVDRPAMGTLPHCLGSPMMAVEPPGAFSYRGATVARPWIPPPRDFVARLSGGESQTRSRHMRVSSDFGSTKRGLSQMSTSGAWRTDDRTSFAASVLGRDEGLDLKRSSLIAMKNQRQTISPMLVSKTVPGVEVVPDPFPQQPADLQPLLSWMSNQAERCVPAGLSHIKSVSLRVLKIVNHEDPMSCRIVKIYIADKHLPLLGQQAVISSQVDRNGQLPISRGHIFSVRLPLDFNRNPDSELCICTEGYHTNNGGCLRIPLAPFIQYGVLSCQGTAIMPGDKDAHPSSATFCLSLHQSSISDVQLTPPPESSGMLACVVQNSAATIGPQHRRENTVATVPNIAALPVGVALDPESGLVRWNRLKITVVKFEDNLRQMPIEIRGESTKDVYCKVSLGSTAALRSKLVDWRDDNRTMPEFEFDYRGERSIRLCLTSTASGSRVIFGFCRVDLEALLRLNRASFRGKVPLTCDDIGDVSLFIQFTKTEHTILSWPAVAWSQACTGATKLHFEISKLIGPDLSPLAQPFFVRLSCGEKRIKSARQHLSTEEANGTSCPIAIQLECLLTRTLLNDADQKDFVVCFYVRPTEDHAAMMAYQYCRMPATLITLPSVLPRCFQGKLQLNTSADLREKFAPMEIECSLSILAA